jgi:hypothetical protein
MTEAEKAIGTLMLEVNRLNNEIILKDEQIEQLKALAISLSHRNANIQYTKAIESFDRTASHMADEYVGWLEENDEQVIANAEKRFPFLKKASEK